MSLFSLDVFVLIKTDKEISSDLRVLVQVRVTMAEVDTKNQECNHAVGMRRSRFLVEDQRHGLHLDLDCCETDIHSHMKMSAADSYNK